MNAPASGAERLESRRAALEAAHAAVSRERSLLARRSLFFVAVAAAAGAATWWLAAACRRLGPTSLHDESVYVPTGQGVLLLFLATIASLTLALLAVSRVRASLRGIPRFLVGLAGCAFVPASCVHGLSTSSDGFELSGCEFESLGDVFYLRWSDNGSEGILSPAIPGHAIVVCSDRSFFRTTYRIEAFTSENNDITAGGFHGVPLIGPSGHGPIVRSKSGVVAVYSVNGWQFCELAWDSVRHCVLWDGEGAREPVHLLTLLDSDDEPEASDVSRLVASTADDRVWMRKQMIDGPTLVTEDDLLSAMNDPRPSVQAAAKAITEAGGKELYPNATKALLVARPK